MLHIGLPAALQMLAMALAEIVLLGLVNRHGSSATAAYGAATQVLGWVQFPAMSLGIAAAIFSAHAVGAGRRERLPTVVSTGLHLNAVLSALFAVAAHLFAPVALRLFLESGPVLAQAVAVARTVAWSVVLLGWSNVLVSAMRASGAALIPALLSMAAIIGVELPVAVVLEARLGLAGVFWASPAAFLTMLLLHGLYYFDKEKKMDLFPKQVSRSARRVAARQARDTFPPMGVYAIRGRASGHLLLGASRNVHAALNRARFELRMGKHADRVLQAEWNRTGVDGLAFDVLELVKEREEADFDYEGELKALKQIYRELEGWVP